MEISSSVWLFEIQKEKIGSLIESNCKSAENILFPGETTAKIALNPYQNKTLGEKDFLCIKQPIEKSHSKAKKATVPWKEVKFVRFRNFTTKCSKKRQERF